MVSAEGVEHDVRVFFSQLMLKGSLAWKGGPYRQMCK